MERLPQPQQSPPAGSQESDGKNSVPEMEGTEMSLREHLLAASAVGNQDQYAPEPAPNHNGPLDPAIIPTNISSPHRGLVTVPIEGHILPPNSHQKGRRELSSSKRAAQNRAAQRAFRQRKEGYIKKLEDQVRNFGQLQESIKNLHSDNYELREYVAVLQNRMSEAGIDVPQPPSSLDLQNAPHASPNPPLRLLEDLTELRNHLAGGPNAAANSAPTASMASSDVSQLQQAAAQAGQFVAQQLDESRRQGGSESGDTQNDEGRGSWFVVFLLLSSSRLNTNLQRPDLNDAESNRKAER